MYQKHRVVCGIHEIEEPEQPIIDHCMVVRLIYIILFMLAEYDDVNVN